MEIIPSDVQIHKPNPSLLKKMYQNEAKEEVLAEIKSNFHDIKIVKSAVGRFLKYLDTNQAGIINTKNYKGNLPYINYFLIPYLMNENIEDILFVGLGSGIIINQYEKIFQKLKRIDVVDIEENILEIAKEYFNFKLSKKTNFHLQDAIIYLKTSKKKYDLIVVDVANNYGIDERFTNIEYLNLIKKHLKKSGMFVSNLPSSIDVFNKKNKFILSLLKNYKKYFKNIDIYNGLCSTKLFYKCFYDIDEVVVDITNLILISSDCAYKINYQNTKIEKLDFELKPYLEDKIIQDNN